MTESVDPAHQIGEPLQGGPEALTAPLAGRVLRAIQDDRRFTLIELRRLLGEPGADVLVVDCKNDEVPTRNKVGIRYVERLALVFPNDDSMPEARALRGNFPATEHQNAVAPGVPASLCLYFEPWHTVARTWTGHGHLRRVARWLADVAAGTLHRADQPVEQFYFTSGWDLVLPQEVRENSIPKEHVLTVRVLDVTGGRGGLLLGSIQPRNAPATGRPISTIITMVPPVVSGRVERPPADLGALHDQLQVRGSDLLHPLIDAFERSVDDQGVEQVPGEWGLLVVLLPIQREAGGVIERIDASGFVFDGGIGLLGATLGVLGPKIQGRFHRVALLDDSKYSAGVGWESITLRPIGVIDDLTPERARQLTGVDSATADFKGSLIGCGSLGSALIDIWNREAWGTWTLVDDDLLKPHNLPRHRASHRHLGHYKVHAISTTVQAVFPKGQVQVKSIAKSAVSPDQDVCDALSGADLIVDASTTLHVPRELSRRNDVRRLASCFLTPSGGGSVLLLEDTERNIRVDALEAQYYRAIIRSDWGSTHLKGHRANELWIGAGCRDVTTVLSPDLVNMHAAILARQLRLRRSQAEPCIAIWQSDDETGAVVHHARPIASALEADVLFWTIKWDEDVRSTVRTFRAASLPNETGGVLVGYIDQVSRTISIVDALSAPGDSISDPESFERGVRELPQKMAEIDRRTAGVVGYIGEWHSHPAGCSTRPSGDDWGQLDFVAAHLRQDGQPAAMMIVGDSGETFVIDAGPA